VTREGNQACGKTLGMGKRHCLLCGGELVMSFRPSEVGRLNPEAENPHKPNTKWRCGTCGQAFTAEQLRAGKRANPTAVSQT
jgi:hypothetical protein